MTDFRILTPDAQYQDDAEVERRTAGRGFEFNIHRVRDMADVPVGQLAGAHALVVWHEVTLAPDVIRRLDNCRIVVRAGVGFDNVDLRASGDAGIPVCNTPDYGTSEVADHALGMLLSLRRGLNYYDARLRRDPVGEFHWAGPPLIGRVRGTRLGIVGLGRIGTATALRARAFGMEVLFHDPYVARGQEIALGIRRVDRLETLLEQVDALSLHTPLTDETRQLINSECLGRMPSHAVLINTARGELVDVDALYEALIHGRIAGAALDVLPEEPPAATWPLIQAVRAGDERLRDRVMLTPHAAWYSPESQTDLRRLSVETAVFYLRDGVLRNCVNAHLLKSA